MKKFSLICFLVFFLLATAALAVNPPYITPSNPTMADTLSCLHNGQWDSSYQYTWCKNTDECQYGDNVIREGLGDYQLVLKNADVKAGDKVECVIRYNSGGYHYDVLGEAEVTIQGAAPVGKVEVTPDKPYNTDLLQCLHNGKWDSSYKYVWDKNGQEFRSTFAGYQLQLTSQITKAGDQWTCTIYYNSGGYHYDPLGSDTVTVQKTNTPPSVSITSPSDGAKYYVGDTIQFAGTVSDPDETIPNSNIVWTSSRDGSLKTGKSFSLSTLSVGTHTITLTATDSAGASTSASRTITVFGMRSLAIAPQNQALNIGDSLTFSATLSYTDGTFRDVSSAATFTSNNANVASMNGRVARALSAGRATITATYSGLSASTSLTVNPSLISITIAPLSPSVDEGQTVQFVAIGHWSDGTSRAVTANWVSSDTTVATINNIGLATAVKSGTTTITANYLGQTASTVFTVTPAVISIEISPKSPTVHVGDAETFSATATYSDGHTALLTIEASWSSSNLAVATMNQNIANALAEGTTRISVLYHNKGDSTVMTVIPTVALDRVEITPLTATIYTDGTQQFALTAFYTDGNSLDVTSNAQTIWSSANNAVATIDNNGFATAHSVGTVSIIGVYNGMPSTATLNVVEQVVLQSIEVLPENLTILVGDGQQFTAIGHYSDGSNAPLTTGLVWGSSDVRVAIIDDTGLTIGASSGVVNITATNADGISGSTTLTVRDRFDLIGLRIDPTTATIFEGQQYSFSAFAVYSDNSEVEVTRDSETAWSSSDDTTATVDNVGVASAVNVGVATITAAYHGFSANATLTVNPNVIFSIDVNPKNQLINIGDKLDYEATATYTNGDIVNITDNATWTSSNDNVANMTGNSAEGAGVGFTTITAAFGGQTGQTLLTVARGTPVSLTIVPDDTTMQIGDTLPFKAFLVYVDNFREEVTGFASWTVSDPAVLSRAGNSVIALKEGESDVYADYAGLRGTAHVTVSALPDTEAPNITLISPADNAVLDNADVKVDYSVDDKSAVAYCRLMVDGAEYDKQTDVPKGVTHEFSATLTEGNHDWYVECQDSSFNTGVSETRHLTIKGALTVKILHPENGIDYPQSTINVEIESNDANADITFDLLDGAGVLIRHNTYDKIAPNQFTLVDGNYTINAEATSGTRTAVDSINFSINTSTIVNDTESPVVDLISPKNGEVVYQNPVMFRYKAQDDKMVEYCEFSIDGNLTETRTIHSPMKIDTMYHNLTEGAHNWNVVCTDGFNKKGASGTFVVTFNSSAKPKPAEVEINGLMISRIIYNEVTSPGETLRFSIAAKNVGNTNLDDLKLSAVIQDLNAESSVKFSLKKGDSATKMLLLDIPEDAKGEYDVRIVVQNGDVKRVLYRTIIVT